MKSSTQHYNLKIPSPAIHRYWFIDEPRALMEAARGGIKAVEDILYELEKCVEEAARGESTTTHHALGGPEENSG